MKNFTLSVFFLLTFFSFHTRLNAACSLKTQISKFYAWDTCKGNGGVNSINAYVTLNSKGCFKYVWTINGVVQSTRNSVINYKVKTNGTYTICVKVMDTCNSCDTTICSTRTISCFTCNWKSRTPNLSLWDTCVSAGTKNTIIGQIYFSNSTNNACFKYQWTSNGNFIGSGKSINYTITANGTYKICVKITDTCNKCDTTICASRTITCINSSNCNWKSKTTMVYWDSCKSNGARENSISAYISLNSGSCYKYQWTINNSYVGNGYYLKYKVNNNGTYTVCVKVTDTCNKCDTTICKQFTVSCLQGCSWYNRSPYVYFNDTCKGNGLRNKINAAISMGSGACYKYTWTVNGTVVATNTAYHSWLVYDVTKNGVYDVCVKVTDTCNQCDTTFCAKKTFSCFTSSCNWKSKLTNFYTWDTCKGAGARNSVNGYLALNTKGCFKYMWKVNSTIVGNSNVFSYNIYNNGTYTICVKVTDTCNNCDTIFCETRTISCFGSGCNWKKNSPNFSAWDTCKGKGGVNSVNASINFNNKSCQKYIWTVNGVIKSNKNNYFNYPITSNGKYIICVKVMDTCNKCDTTFCSTRTISCFNNCNFKSRNPILKLYDSCYSGKSIITGSISFGNKTCLKYQWTLSGNVVSSFNNFNAAVYKNGNYSICVKITDTCNKCDTTFCMTKTINCNSLSISKAIGANEKISIYPNPVKETLTIDWEGKTVNFDIVNVIGSTLYNGELISGKNTININNLSNGIYMVRVNSINGIRQYKIVVNR